MFDKIFTNTVATNDIMLSDYKQISGLIRALTKYYKN